MTTKHNNHPAQLAYRAALASFDVIDNAWDTVSPADDLAFADHEAAWDAAAVTEHQAADDLIRWAWTVIATYHPTPETAGDLVHKQRALARSVVDAALACHPEQRARMIDLSNRMTA